MIVPKIEDMKKIAEHLEDFRNKHYQPAEIYDYSWDFVQEAVNIFTREMFREERHNNTLNMYSMDEVRRIEDDKLRDFRNGLFKGGQNTFIKLNLMFNALALLGKHCQELGYEVFYYNDNVIPSIDTAMQACNRTYIETGKALPVPIRIALPEEHIPDLADAVVFKLCIDKKSQEMIKDIFCLLQYVPLRKAYIFNEKHRYVGDDPNRFSRCVYDNQYPYNERSQPVWADENRFLITNVSGLTWKIDYEAPQHTQANIDNLQNILDQYETLMRQYKTLCKESRLHDIKSASEEYETKV